MYRINRETAVIKKYWYYEIVETVINRKYLLDTYHMGMLFIGSYCKMFSHMHKLTCTLIVCVFECVCFVPAIVFA